MYIPACLELALAQRKLVIKREGQETAPATWRATASWSTGAGLSSETVLNN